MELVLAPQRLRSGQRAETRLEAERRRITACTTSALYGAGASQSVAGGGAALYGRSVTKPRDASVRSWSIFYVGECWFDASSGQRDR